MADFTFPSPVSAAVFGAGGGIGSAFVEALAKDPVFSQVHAISRRAVDVPAGVTAHRYDPRDQADIERVVGDMGTDLGLVIVTVGTLHDPDHGPEKALRQLQPDRLAEVMRINAGLPMQIAQAVAPQMAQSGPRVFAALSARVGSISDNRIGGWYAYRASKAALNQLIRTWSVELARKNDKALAVTLHPGTVDTELSSPFQGNVPEGKLFTPEYSVGRMLDVLRSLEPQHSGRCYDYAGDEIAP